MPNLIVLSHFNTVKLKLVCFIKVQMGLSNGAHLQDTVVDLIPKHDLRFSNLIELFLTKVGLEDTILLLKEFILFVFYYFGWFGRV